MTRPQKQILGCSLGLVGSCLLLICLAYLAPAMGLWASVDQITITKAWVAEDRLPDGRIGVFGNIEFRNDSRATVRKIVGDYLILDESRNILEKYRYVLWWDTLRPGETVLLSGAESGNLLCTDQRSCKDMYGQDPAYVNFIVTDVD